MLVSSLLKTHTHFHPYPAWVTSGDLCEILVSREHESIWYPGLVLSVDNKKGGCRVKYLNAGRCDYLIATI